MSVPRDGKSLLRQAKKSKKVFLKLSDMPESEYANLRKKEKREVDAHLNKLVRSAMEPEVEEEVKEEDPSTEAEVDKIVSEIDEKIKVILKNEQTE